MDASGGQALVDASGGQALEVALCSWGTGRSVLLGTGSNLEVFFEGDRGTGSLIWRYSSRGTGS